VIAVADKTTFFMFIAVSPILRFISLIIFKKQPPSSISKIIVFGRQITEMLLPLASCTLLYDKNHHYIQSLSISVYLKLYSEQKKGGALLRRPFSKQTAN